MVDMVNYDKNGKAVYESERTDRLRYGKGNENTHSDSNDNLMDEVNDLKRRVSNLEEDNDYLHRRIMR